MTIINNNITFNNIKEPTTGVNVPIGGKFNDYDWDINTGEITGVKNHSIQALDIYWNEAVLDNTYLSTLDNNNTVVTTGQLLSLINDMQAQINALTYYYLENRTKYYWYVLTSVDSAYITPNNYTQFVQQVTKYPSSTTVSSEESKYLYIIIPTNKNISVIDPSNGLSANLNSWRESNGRYVNIGFNGTVTINGVEYYMIRSTGTFTGNLTITIS